MWPQRARVWAPWVLLFGVAIGLRFALIYRYPVVYDWDAFSRLWHPDTLFVRHWLPLPQLPVVLLGENLFLVRGVYAVIGGCAAIILGLAVERLWNRASGLTAAALVGTFSVALVWSIVPYQEPFLSLFLGCTLYLWPAGVPFRVDRGAWLGAAALALGCLCRYEMWILTAVFAVVGVERKRTRSLALLLLPAAVAMTSWSVVLVARDPPASGPPQMQVAESIATLPTDLAAVASVLQTSVFEEPRGALDLAWHSISVVSVMVAYNLTWPLLGLALWGLLRALRSSETATRELALFGIGSAALVVVRTYGAEGLLTLRMPHGLMVVALLFSAIGLVELSTKLPPRVRVWGVAVPVVAAAALFAQRGDTMVASLNERFAPERLAAEFLSRLPAEIPVAILPREIETPWNESTIGAIFAQDLSLDRRSQRWLYAGQQSGAFARPPDYVVRWTRWGYRSEKVGAVEGREIVASIEAVPLKSPSVED